MQFSPNGKTIASGSADKTVRLWDANTGTLLKTLTEHTGDVHSVQFSPNGKTIASASSDKTVRLWDASTGTLLKTFTGHIGEVHSVQFSPNGKTIASGSADKTVRLWDATTGERLYTLTGHPSAVLSVCFNPNGKTIASGSWNNIRLWDVPTGTLRKTLTDHRYISSVCFSPNGKTLASGGEDESICLWDVNTGKPLIGYPSFGIDLETCGGLNYPVLSMCFSPDGHTLAIGGGTDYDADWDDRRSHTARLWDANTGTRLMTLNGHTSYISSVHFSSDGHTLASGSHDGTVLLWDIAPDTGR